MNRHPYANPQSPHGAAPPPGVGPGGYPPHGAGPPYPPDPFPPNAHRWAPQPPPQPPGFPWGRLFKLIAVIAVGAIALVVLLPLLELAFDIAMGLIARVTAAARETQTGSAAPRHPGPRDGEPSPVASLATLGMILIAAIGALKLYLRHRRAENHALMPPPRGGP